MKLTSRDLLELKIIDEIVMEPSGGAHRDRDQILLKLKKSLRKHLDEFSSMSKEDIIAHRKKKFLNIGRNENNSLETLSSMSLFSDGVSKIFKVRNKFKSKTIYIIGLSFAIGIILLYFFNYILDKS